MYEIKAIQVATTLAPGPHVYYQQHWGEWLPFAFYVWLVRGEGRTILVDTGMPTGPYLDRLQANLREVDPSLEYRDIVPVETALAREGIDSATVDGVFITNFVIHSTGGLDRFANAKIYLSARGWLDYWVPEFPHPFGRDIFFTPDTLTWLATEAWDRVVLLDGEAEPLPGVRTFWTGCHHRSSTAVSFQAEGGRAVVFEPAFHFGNIEENIPIGVLESIADWHAAHARGQQEIAEGGILLPQHDPELLNRFPGGRIDTQSAT